MNFARKLLILVVAAILGGAAIPNSPVRADQSAVNEIAIKDFEFSPRILTVRAGSKVTWTNKDEEPHKVVEVNSAFTSQPLDTDNNFTYEFDAPGTYEYFCSLHPHMTGKIVVEK
jgi:plastocyanin